MTVITAYVGLRYNWSMGGMSNSTMDQFPLELMKLSITILHNYTHLFSNIDDSFELTLSILLPTNILTISCFVEYVSSSFSQLSSLANDCLLDTS